METTFITIHDLTRDASIRYASDSITVVLGYQPVEVLDRSCWDYFHPQELPFARSIHGRGVRLDKAAVLNYCSIRHKDGSWVCCECVFTVVYDVLIASTTVYGGGKGSQNSYGQSTDPFQRTERAVDAPIVRQLFTSSPNDPRYHMLTWISNKFSQRLTEPPHEPRAAMFINRFTRTATIMYATRGVSEILGVEPGQLISQSFYFCMQEQCLPDAIRCLESAKANDSIAYLRFWFRNPLQSSHNGVGSAIQSSPIELEAVVSCTSDGLVVILRRARAPLPIAPVSRPVASPLTSGVFAAPWAPEPVLSYGTQSHLSPTPISVTGHTENGTTLCRDSIASGSAARKANPEVQTTLCREGMESSPTSASDSMYSSEKGSQVAEGPGQTGPHSSRLMDTIREVAVFAWGIVGINRDLEQYTCGTPTGNAHPGEKMDVDEVKQEEPEEKM